MNIPKQKKCIYEVIFTEFYIFRKLYIFFWVYYLSQSSYKHVY